MAQLTTTDAATIERRPTATRQLESEVACGRCRDDCAPAAVARCRYCALVLCSEHLVDALRPARWRLANDCYHVFLAHGWLARSLGRPSAPA